MLSCNRKVEPCEWFHFCLVDAASCVALAGSRRGSLTEDEAGFLIGSSVIFV